VFKSRQLTIAVIALIGVNAIWGLSFPIMKFLNLQIDTHFSVIDHEASFGLRLASVAWMISIRFGLALALLTVCFRDLMRNASRTEWKAGACIGVCFYFGLICQVAGLATIPASRSGFLTSLTAVFVPLSTFILIKRAPDFLVGCGIVVALLGVAVLTEIVEITTYGLNFAPQVLQLWTLGDTLTTVGAICFTGQILLIDVFSKRMNSAGFTPGMFTAVVGLALLTFIIAKPFAAECRNASWTSLAIKPTFLPLLGILGSVCSLIAFVGMNKYQPYVTATQASIIYSLEPVFASGWALVLPGWLSTLTGIAYANEKWTIPLGLGGTLILLANVIVLWPSGCKSQGTERSP